MDTHSDIQSAMNSIANTIGTNGNSDSVLINAWLQLHNLLSHIDSEVSRFTQLSTNSSNSTQAAIYLANCFAQFSMAYFQAFTQNLNTSIQDDTQLQ